MSFILHLLDLVPIYMIFFSYKSILMFIAIVNI